MSKHIDKLLSIASDPEATTLPRLDEPRSDLFTPDLHGGLISLLRRRNGFYAFESALHVFAAGPGSSGSIGLEAWNAPETWRDTYGDLAEGCLFFAEDVFGNQFCIHQGGIHSFDAETGEKETIAPDVDAWADAVLNDYEYLTGYPLARQWQHQNGRLAKGQRLVPKQPFVLGGEFSVENLAPLDAVEGMRFRGDLANQLRHLPDGATVRLKTTD